MGTLPLDHESCTLPKEATIFGSQHFFEPQQFLLLSMLFANIWGCKQLFLQSHFSCAK
jgi:hypothetical protein